MCSRPMTSTVDLRACFRRGAYYVQKILSGVVPGDLPVEFPTKLELVINLKTARALDLEISPMLLARAGQHMLAASPSLHDPEPRS